MSFEPLADLANLAARNIAVPGGFDASELLASASDAIRDAAGCPITRATSTVPLPGTGTLTLDLPGVPIVSVASVSLDGVLLTDWKLRASSSLHRWCGWCVDETYQVTYTHGLVTIPGDIVELTCSMVAMALNGAGGGYGAFGITQAQHLGNAGESFFVPVGGSLLSPMALPDRVRDRLRARFGTSAVAVVIR